MCDASHGQFEGRSINLTTQQGKTTTWTPRPHTIWPKRTIAPTSVNSPVEKRNPESWTNGFYVPTKQGSSPELARERGDEKQRDQNPFNFGFATSENNHTAQTLKSNGGKMDKLREFWSPVKTLKSSEDLAHARSILTPRKPMPMRRSHAGTIDSIDSMDYQPPSALDCARTRKCRNIDQRARGMISTSLSTTDGLLDVEYSNVAGKHKGWGRSCRCKGKGKGKGKGKYKSKQAPQEDASGQDAGNIGIPEGVEYLDTCSDSEESMVRVILDVEDPFDDNIFLRKTHDLRALDSMLMEKSHRLPMKDSYQSSSGNSQQSPTRSEIICQFPRPPQTQTQPLPTHNDIDNAHKSKMPFKAEDLQIAYDDEISDLEIPSPAHHRFHLKEGKELAVRLGDLPKLITDVPSDVLASTNQAQSSRQNATDTEEISEKLSGTALVEQADTRTYNVEIKDDERPIVVKEMKEAMETLLFDPDSFLNNNDQPSNKVAQLPRRTESLNSRSSENTRRRRTTKKAGNKETTEALPGLYVELSADEFFSSSPTNICATHPSLDDDEDSRPPSPRIGSYPARDSSATSLDFGFRPTQEFMPGSWPEEPEYFADSEPEDTQQGGRTWRDISVKDLSDLKAGNEVSPFARFRKVQDSCRPPISFGRGSDDSVTSVEAH